jgi:Putative phage tail protein
MAAGDPIPRGSPPPSDATATLGPIGSRKLPGPNWPDLPGGSKWPYPTSTPTSPSTDPLGGGWLRVIDERPSFGSKKGKSTAARLQTIGGNNSIIPIIYGRQRVGARIGAVLRHESYLVLLCVWCRGEVDAVESTLANNASVPGAVEQTHYTGTSAQNPDATLIAAALANGITYTDDLRGICYSVFKFRARSFDGFPRFTAQIRGMKVRATENGARAWSQNPALCLADFIESSEYGCGKTCDWATVAVAADYCDELVGTPTEVRRQLDIVLDQQQDTLSWVQTLRSYAGCWAMEESGIYRLVPDADSASVYTINEDNIIAGTENFSWRGAKDVPTVVAVDYVDTTGAQYRDNRVMTYANGVLEGTAPRRVTSIQRSGTTRFSEANRHSIETLNKATLIDMAMECVIEDSSLALNLCDIVTVTHPVGITNKKFRVMRIAHADHGRWRIGMVEHDPTVYSDVVESSPGVVDTDLPSPNNPPVVTGLAASEYFYMTKDGSLASRISLAWDAVDYPFFSYYMVECFEGSVAGVLAFVADSSSNAFVTPPIKEGQQYVLRVTVVSASGARGDGDVETITPLGKLALPADVPAFSVYSSNGTSYAEWEKPSDLDITGYELRWSAQSGSWEAAAYLAFVAAPTLNFSTTQMIPGDVRMWIKALDSVRTIDFPNGQESVNANYVDYTSIASSTSNTSDYGPGTITLSNMVQVEGGYVTAVSGDTWGGLFGSALNTYTNALVTYHGSATSGLVSDTIDLASSELTFLMTTLAHVDLSGTGQVYIEHKVLVGDSWTRVNASTASVVGRYFRWGIEATTTETIFVTDVGALRATRDETENFVKHTVLNDAVAWML